VVIVGTVIGYSADGGFNFSSTTVSGFSAGYDVAYSLSLQVWVAVGSGTITAVVSYDGGNWNVSELTTTFDVVGYAITWSDAQSLFVAGGTSSLGYCIATSTDGVNWLAQNSPFTGSVRGVAYSPQRNIWIAVGTGSALIARSVDGITWISTVTYIPTLVGTHAAWGAEAGLFLVALTGGGGGSEVSTAKSYDGISWIFSDVAFHPQAFATGSVWNSTQFYVTGLSTTDTLMTTADGTTFVGQGKSALPITGYGVCLASDFSKLFLVGTGAITSVPYDGSPQTSIVLSDMLIARRCFARYTSVPSITSPSVPSYTADFVSTGQGASTLAYSLDGGRYFNPGGATIFSTAGYSVAYSLPLTRWVAVGQGTNTGAYSSNGVAWTASASLTSILTTYGYDVAWSTNQSQWVAGGIGASFKIATSPDGITWTGRSSPFATAVMGVAYSPARNIWVACGSGTAAIASSPDGVVTILIFFRFFQKKK
jgi:hypothetical protein